MITIQIDEKKYNKIVDDVENSLDFTLYDDYQTFASRNYFFKNTIDLKNMYKLKERY